jgi:aldose 1-epimerase
MLNTDFLAFEQSPVLFFHQDNPVYLFILRNKAGVEVEISNLGTIIRSFKVPGKSGKLVDIVLGLDTMEDYLDESYIQTKTYLGAIIGRYANRIGNSSFEIDGQQFSVAANIPPHQLHGGMEGFDKKVWEFISSDQSPNPKLTLAYLSKDGEEGFPGNLNVEVTFELTDESELIIATQATTDKAGPINLTHHDYFNLKGQGSTDGHIVEIQADYSLGQDNEYVASGEVLPVGGTPRDFRQAKIARLNSSDNEGFDQSFLLNKEYNSWGPAASCYCEESGIKLSVFTDEPTVHFYTGKYLNIPGKNGVFYSAFDGLCFETQHHTNSVNIPAFPSTVLRAGEVYKHKTLYKVGLYS